MDRGTGSVGVRYYDIDGQPITMDEWAERFKDNRVALEERGDVSVSTVWLGLDHQYGDGPPLIFETMIFGGEHDQDQWRYSTREGALAGHAAAVALVFGVSP